MSKRPHCEVVKSIQFKLIDAVKQQADANDEKEETTKKMPKAVGIYTGTDYGERKRLFLDTAGTLPIDASALNTITIHGMQDWVDGISDEVVQWLRKLVSADARGTDHKVPERRKYCLFIALPYAFKDNQEGIFGKNLSALLAVPGLLQSVGAFAYSEGGNLADFLSHFPQLVQEPSFPQRYDVHVYAENDTLVEDYFADVKHWLIELNNNDKNTSAQKQQIRQCRLKFVLDRADTAEEMLKLIKEDFDKATDANSRRTFVVRLDCPGFVLDEFCVTSDKTGEVLALKFKHAQVLKAEDDDEGMTDGATGDDDEGQSEKGTTTTTTEAPEGKKSRDDDGKAAAATDETQQGDDDDDEASVVEWNTYLLFRCPSVAELDQLSSTVDVPFLCRSLSIIY